MGQASKMDQSRGQSSNPPRTARSSSCYLSKEITRVFCLFTVSLQLCVFSPSAFFSISKGIGLTSFFLMVGFSSGLC